MAVEIKKSILTQQVEEGWKRKALAEYYELPETQMAQVLKDAGLKIRKFHAPAFVLVTDDVATEEIDNPATTEVVDAPEEVAEEALTEAAPNIWKD